MEAPEVRIQLGGLDEHQDPGPDQPSDQRQPRHLPVNQCPEESHQPSRLPQDGQQGAVQDPALRRLRRSGVKLIKLYSSLMLFRQSKLECLLTGIIFSPVL
jgi:hypothetical protein